MNGGVLVYWAGTNTRGRSPFALPVRAGSRRTLKEAPVQMTKAKLQIEELSPERVAELRDAVLALVDVRGVKALRSVT